MFWAIDFSNDGFNNSRKRMKIYLIGMPGSGKSTIGRPLAERLSIPFFDLDSIIEQEEGMAVRDIFATKGENYFRELERHWLEKTSDSYADFVLSTGGGTPCFFENMKFMKENGEVIYLETDISTLAERLQKEGLKLRPLLKEYTTTESLKTYLMKTYSKRNIFFEKADFLINSKNESPHQVVNKIFSYIKN